MSEKKLLKENVSHGSISFPLCVYANDLGYNEHLLDYHWHNEIEFLYLKKGKAVFQIDSTPVELHENEAVFVNRGEIHAGYSLDHSYCVYYSIVFSLEMLYSTLQDICYDRYFRPLINGECKLPQKISAKSHWEKEILKRINHTIDAYSTKPAGYEIEIKSVLLGIFYLLFSNDAVIHMHGKTNAVKQYQTERLKIVLNFIKDHYAEAISVEDIAKEVNLTRYHFCRVFKTLTGQTPIEYINHFRVNQAVRLLEDDTRKIMDIAFDVGFNNFSYFIEIFKRYKNCTPSEYRRSTLI